MQWLLRLFSNSRWWHMPDDEPTAEEIEPPHFARCPLCGHSKPADGFQFVWRLDTAVVCCLECSGVIPLGETANAVMILEQSTDPLLLDVFPKEKP